MTNDHPVNPTDDVSSEPADALGSIIVSIDRWCGDSRHQWAIEAAPSGRFQAVQRVPAESESRWTEIFRSEPVTDWTSLLGLLPELTTFVSEWEYSLQASDSARGPYAERLARSHRNRSLDAARLSLAIDSGMEFTLLDNPFNNNTLVVFEDRDYMPGTELVGYDWEGGLSGCTLIEVEPGVAKPFPYGDAWEFASQEVVLLGLDPLNRAKKILTWVDFFNLRGELMTVVEPFDPHASLGEQETIDCLVLDLDVECELELSLDEATRSALYSLVITDEIRTAFREPKGLAGCRMFKSLSNAQPSRASQDSSLAMSGEETSVDHE